MPIKVTAAAATTARPRALDNPRVRRILRFFIAVTLATAVSCYISWSGSLLLVAMIVSLMTMPAPAPSLSFAMGTVVKFNGCIVLGVALMLPLASHQIFGFALVGLILFVYFYIQAQGKATSLTGTMLVICTTLTAAFGQNSMDGGIEFAKSLSKCSLALFPIIWIAFAVLPEGVFPRLPNVPRVEGSAVDRGIIALRPVFVLLPLFVFMLGSDNSIRYLIGYYQAAMIAQHPGRATAKALALDLLLATLIGSTAGLALWWIVKLWPSLFWFTLMMGLFSFYFATRIFKNDPRGLFPHFVRWSYGLTTLVFIVFPEAMSQGFSGDDANMKFYQRILDYLFVTSYSVFGVLLYDAIVERLAACRRWTRGWSPLKKNPGPRQA